MPNIISLVALLVAFTSTAHAGTEYQITVRNESNTPIQFEIFQPRCLELQSVNVAVPAKHEASQVLIQDPSPACIHETKSAELVIPQTGTTVQIDSRKSGELSVKPKSPHNGLDVRTTGSTATISVSKDGLERTPPVFQMQPSSLVSKKTVTLRDKLLSVATFPQVISEYDSKADAPAYPLDLLTDLRHTTSHLKIPTENSNPHDPRAEIRDEAIAIIHWMDAHHTKEVEHSSKLLPDLDKAIRAHYSIAAHSTGNQYENATSQQQQMNTNGQAGTNQGVTPIYEPKN